MQKLIEIIESFGFVKFSKEGETPYVYKHSFRDQSVTIYGSGGRMKFEGEPNFLWIRPHSKEFSIEETSCTNFKQTFASFLQAQK